jgi:hypothetical protein
MPDGVVRDAVIKNLHVSRAYPKWRRVCARSVRTGDGVDLVSVRNLRSHTLRRWVGVGCAREASAAWRGRSGWRLFRVNAAKRPCVIPARKPGEVVTGGDLCDAGRGLSAPREVRRYMAPLTQLSAWTSGEGRF